MTFLPIVQRELRVAARLKRTHYARAAVALLAIVVSGFWLLVLQLGMPSGRGGVGAAMFSLFSWYALLTSLLAGLFLAHDSLSGERREGTLGLLFLTDLKGYDVVLGKFTAVSLDAFYGLLAVFPVLALCLLVGGVLPAEFWRICLALVNILFSSIAAAMVVSAFCQSAYRALMGSITLLLTWLAATGIASTLTGAGLIGYVSPFLPFVLARQPEYLRMAQVYWISLAMSHLLGWLFLACAGWRVRKYAEKAGKPDVLERIFPWNLAFGGATRQRSLLEINPVLWLLDDSRRLRWVTWGLSLAGTVSLIIMELKGWKSAPIISVALVWPVYLLLKVFFAVQACRFFDEARRTRSVELLYCAPLAPRTIVEGQWLHLRRLFLWPVIMLLSAQLVLSICSVVFGPDDPVLPFMLLKSMLNNLADFLAIGWFGMWLALTMRKPHLAAGLTLLCVVILPPVLFCIPTVMIDGVFILIGWVKVSEESRLRARLL